MATKTITGIQAGTTTITASFGGKTSSVSFTVNAIAPSLTFTASGSTLTYNGSTQNIGTVSYTGDGTAYYIVKTSSSVPAANDSGWTSVANGTTIKSSAATATTYYVFLKSSAGTNYSAVDPKSAGSKAIGKRTVTVTAPTVKSDTIRYTGSAQALLSGNGSCTAGGTMYYYCSTSSTAPTVSGAPGTGWSTTAPSKTDVGTYYIWYYAYVSDTTNNTGTNINTVKSLNSKAIERRIGAAPTFSASSVSATAVQAGSAVNAGTFTAATAGHGGSITYSIVSVVEDGSSTQLTGWTMTSTTSRVITVPASTAPATYLVTVRATEAQTTTDTSSYKDAVITVTLSKGTQTLNLNKATLKITYPDTGTITASGYAGTLSVTSGTTSVATVSLSSATATVTPVSAGTSTVTFTAAETTYVNAATASATVTVYRRTGAAPTFNNSSVTATCSQDQSAKTTSAFTAATAGHGGTLSYSLTSVKNSDDFPLPCGSGSTSWNLTSSTRKINVPANVKSGTYTCIVRVTEAATSTDSSSTADATITLTMSKGTQTLTLTNNPSSKTITYNNTGTVTASGHVGTISASSATTSVATVSTSGAVVTVQSVGAGTSVITVTAAANDYVNAKSETVTWTVNRRTGAAPTFNDSSVTATCVQAGSAVNAGAFTAATAGHSGSITYAIQGVTKSGSSTALTGWTMTSTTSRVITVPASTLPGTYLVVVRATEAATSTDSSSTKDATITVTLSKGSQSLTLTSSPTNSTTTYPTGGTITASGHAGTISASSATTSVATVSASSSTVTVAAVGQGTSVITVTAAATDYVNSVSKTVTWTINRRTGAVPTFNASSVSATCVQAGSAVNAGTFTAATAGHGGSITYSIVSVVEDGSSTQLTGWTMTSTTSRIITVPASTVGGKTYLVTVRATEAATSTDTSSTKDAVITVTLNKGSQTLNLSKTTSTVTVGGSTDTITASGYAGTLTVTSGTPAVATASNEASSTITAVKAGTSTITFAAAATNYVNAVSKTATVTVNRRTGSAPTFNNSSVTATCSQDQTAKTTSAFTAGTATHSGALSYSLVSAKNSGGSTLSGWSVNSSNRTIGIPANTVSGTYTVVVRCTEGQTDYDTSSTKDATITVTLSKGTQSLTLTSSPTNSTTTYPTGGTITASGHVGTISASSGTTSVATITTSGSTVTVTAVGQGTSVITVTAAANDYVDSVSKTVTWTINRRTGAAPTFADGTVTATCSQDQTAKTTSAFTAGTAKHGGTLSYSLVSAKNSGGSTLSGWSVTSSSRKINIPANTIAGTYTCVVRCTEGQTSTDTSSTTDATITVTLSKGSQSLTLTGNPTNYTTTYNNGGTITASGHVGTISASSATTSVATVSVSGSTVTVTCAGAGTSVITVTAAGNDYVNSVSKTATWTINKANATLPSTISGDSATAGSVAYHNTARATVSKDYTGGTLKYSTDGGSNWSNVTWSSGNLTANPNRTALGSTSVIFKVVGDANHNDSGNSGAVTLTVYAAEDARMVVDLTARTYNTNAQVVASVDTTSTGVGGNYHGISSYSLGFGSSSTSAPSSGTSSASLSATNAGDYYVWYKYTANAEHGGATTSWTYVGKVTISKASRSGAVSCNNVTYGSTVTATVSGNTESGTVTWGITPGTGIATINSSGVVTPTKAGTVTVTASVAATSNYAAYTATSKTITINKAQGTITYSSSASVSEYCTATAAAVSKTDANKTITVATASASNATGTISYAIGQSGWSISSDGKTITVPANTNAGTYNTTVSATSAATDNYTEKTVTNNIAVTLTATVLTGIVLALTANSVNYGGSTTVASVIATYNNGATTDVKDNSGTTYSSDPTGIVTIS